MVLFIYRVFNIFDHLAEEKMDYCFDVYIQSYAYFKYHEQNLIFCRFYVFANLILYLSLADVTKNLFYDSNFSILVQCTKTPLTQN